VTGEVVVPPAAADAAELGVLVEQGLVDRPGVVVQAADQREVDLQRALGNAEGERPVVHPAELVDALGQQRIRPLDPAERPERRARVTGVAGHQVEQLVDTVRIEPEALAGEPGLDLGARQLAEPIDLVQHGLVALGRDPERGEQAAQDLAVVEVDGERAERKLGEDGVDDRRDLGVVGQRQAVLADHVDVALVELAEPALLVALAAVHALDLVAPEREVELCLVLGDEARQRHRQIEPQRELGQLAGVAGLLERARRLHEVHLLLGLAPGLGEQHVGQLEHRGLDRHEPEALEAAPDRVQHVLERELLRGQELEHTGRGSGLDRHGYAYHDSARPQGDRDGMRRHEDGSDPRRRAASAGRDGRPVQHRARGGPHRAGARLTGALATLPRPPARAAPGARRAGRSARPASRAPRPRRPPRGPRT
jgi:hypothetical protein